MDMSLDRRGHIRYRPEVLDQEHIKIGNYEIDIKRIRCLLPADEIAPLLSKKAE